MRPNVPTRLIARPMVQFRTLRPQGRRPRLTARRLVIVYHSPRGDRRATTTVHALRCQTSRYRFPDLGRLATSRGRRTSLPLGLPPARHP